MTTPSTRTPTGGPPPAGGSPPPQQGGSPFGSGIPLGRWAGVAVSAHWTVLFTLALFADVLATSALPAACPAQGGTAYWVAGVLTAAVFLVTLLAHELAHALVARHYQIRVKKITLWMLGGLTELDREPDTPRADGLIAVAGPATSVGIGAVSAALAWWTHSGGLLGAALAWLAGASILIGLFNLLPGSPLDGGRVLRALLWSHYHDRARGVSGAARAGRTVGIALVILGFFEVLAGSLGGLWLALIGWFICAGAAGERSAALTGQLTGLRAAEVMTPTPTVVPEWWTVQQFLTQLSPAQITQPLFPLVDFAGHATSVTTLQQLERIPSERREETRLRDITRLRRIRPLLVPPEAPLNDIAAGLRSHGGVAIVVNADTQPVGVITVLELRRAAERAKLGWRSPAAHPS